MKKIEEIINEVQKLLELTNKLKNPANIVLLACDKINSSWSGSDLVGHADLFYKNYEEPPRDKRFNIEWGLLYELPEGWQERNQDEILRKIEENLEDTSLNDLDKTADNITSQFEELRKETILHFLEFSKESAIEIEKFNLKTKNDIFNQYWNREIRTRDSVAFFAGRKIPTHKYYKAMASFLLKVSAQLVDFIYLVKKSIAQNKNNEQEMQESVPGINTYIDKNTILRLSKIKNNNFDLSRLILLCKELDDNYSLENYHSCGMLIRAILDHIPPIFEKDNFENVSAQYGGKSFKEIIKPLNETAKKIGDDYLHTQISKKVLTVTRTQVNFRANLDILLNEVASILEK